MKLLDLAAALERVPRGARARSQKWEVTAEVEKFDEACSWFMKRTVMTKDQAFAMDADLRQRAFWVGAGLQLDQIQRVFTELKKAQASGEPFEDWRKRVRDDLPNNAHAETVFRNASQRALSAGRLQQMLEPGVAKFRPFWIFDTVLDSRTTPVCTTRNGTTLPLDHPWWQTNTPPLHHRCRSGLRSLRKAEAERRGITTNPTDEKAPGGFGRWPLDEKPWKPDPKKYEPALYVELEKKAEHKPRKKKAPPAAPKPEHDPAFWADKYRKGEGDRAKDYEDAADAIGWGRAMLERGLDRSGIEVADELDRLRLAGHPLMIGMRTEIQYLRDIGNQKTGESLLGGLPQIRGLIAIQEHTRTIKPGAFPLPTVKGDDRNGAIKAAQTWYELMLDQSVKRPTESPGKVTLFQPAPALQTVLFQPKVRAFHQSAGGLIVLDENGDAKTAVHELAHAIETANEPVYLRSKKFLRVRTKGESPRKMSEVTGNSAYDDYEVTLEDKFIEPYMGKDYKHLATEVTSMGYEILASRWFSEQGELMAKDADYYFFMLGQLAGR